MSQALNDAKLLAQNLRKINGDSSANDIFHHGKCLKKFEYRYDASKSNLNKFRKAKRQMYSQKH